MIGPPAKGDPIASRVRQLCFERAPALGAEWPPRSLQRHTESFNSLRTRHNSKPVADLTDLTKARSMLILLLATCKQSLLALEAAANVLDTDLTRDLDAMITRSETELVALNARIEALGD